LLSEDAPAEVTVPEVRLPPAVKLPKLVQTFGVIVSNWIPAKLMLKRLARYYGEIFTLNLPFHGRSVIVGDPSLAKRVFMSRPDELGIVHPNLGQMFGPGTVLALDGTEHRRRRRLLGPPLHGNSVKAYEAIFEEETLREIAMWPEGQLFATLPSMMRITLNSILRAVFGAEGAEVDELRRVIPPWVALASRLIIFPEPSRDRFGRLSPWRRLMELRRQYELVVDKLIERTKSDPNVSERTDLLALMLRTANEDGSYISRTDIGDELIALLVAGHETTAATLAWAFERLTRHADLLAALADEADNGGRELRQAAISEVLRTRPVLDYAARQVRSEAYQLGEWCIPRGHSIFVSIAQVHDDPDVFPDPYRFDPQRYIGPKSTNSAWIPFGGGVRRCVGASFANVEMDVVLRTVLRYYTIEPTTAPSERWHCRGLASVPKDGGRIVVRRRR
jgi:cytochrome P450